MPRTCHLFFVFQLPRLFFSTCETALWRSSKLRNKRGLWSTQARPHSSTPHQYSRGAPLPRLRSRSAGVGRCPVSTSIPQPHSTCRRCSEAPALKPLRARSRSQHSDVFIVPDSTVTHQPAQGLLFPSPVHQDYSWLYYLFILCMNQGTVDCCYSW